ncbi:MAG: hypothetical protein HRT89_06485 [Lentisphaeria bacterium]|nr:heme NO-binding domain-containing protein [Lentisphaeria bacterium]NQZ67700.1 hypothetical protein [Lentisphaeria bacterium]
MVNEPFKAYYEKNHGADKWQEIIDKAAVSTKESLSMEQYPDPDPDSDSVALVVAGSKLSRITLSGLI